MDTFFRVSCNITGKSTLRTDLHYFSSPTDIYNPEDPARQLSKYLGTEIDLTFKVNLSPIVSMNAGYSQLFGTAALEAIKGNTGSKGIANNWAWAMITVKPMLLHTTRPAE